MPRIQFVVEIGDVDDPDFNITDEEADSIKVSLENVVEEAGYVVDVSFWRRDDEEPH